jgi:hypothetical protein
LGNFQFADGLAVGYFIISKLPLKCSQKTAYSAIPHYWEATSARICCVSTLHVLHMLSKVLSVQTARMAAPL